MLKVLYEKIEKIKKKQKLDIEEKGPLAEYDSENDQ